MNVAFPAFQDFLLQQQQQQQQQPSFNKKRAQLHTQETHWKSWIQVLILLERL